jgi:vanillate/3-O-methylgallate O-demethylase
MEMPYRPYRAIEADSVLRDGEEVGVSTGRGYSYYFREMLSLGTIDREYSDPGTEVTIVWGEGGDPANPRIQPHAQKEITATVAPAPYKPDRRRSELD